MKRRIEFRAWDKKYREMITNVETSTRWAFMPVPKSEDDEYVLMQFTGKTDYTTAFAPSDCKDDDNEIYEGDILAVVLADGIGFNGEVYFNEDDGQWRIAGKGHDIPLYCNFHMIIAGNIYQNPELLK
jgi:hypothetical protein